MGVNQARSHLRSTFQAKLLGGFLRESISHGASRRNHLGTQLLLGEVSKPDLLQEGPVPAVLMLGILARPVVPLANQGAERPNVGPCCLVDQPVRQVKEAGG